MCIVLPQFSITFTKNTTERYDCISNKCEWNGELTECNHKRKLQTALSRIISIYYAFLLIAFIWLTEIFLLKSSFTLSAEIQNKDDIDRTVITNSELTI